MLYVLSSLYLVPPPQLVHPLSSLNMCSLQQKMNNSHTYKCWQRNNHLRIKTKRPVFCTKLLRKYRPRRPSTPNQLSSFLVEQEEERTTQKKLRTNHVYFILPQGYPKSNKATDQSFVLTSSKILTAYEVLVKFQQKKRKKEPKPRSCENQHTTIKRNYKV